MDTQQFYTISELAEHAGVTTRTIRYYAAEGLLPPPDTRGKYARYSNDHLLRLQMITRLKDTYLPLSEIRNRLDGLNTAELQSLLIEAQQSSTTEPDVNAASYVARILQSYPGGSRTIAEQPTAYQQVPMNPPAAPVPMINESAAKKMKPMASSDQGLETAREHWQRITLSSDVELHIREPQSEEIRERIHQLIEHASILFSEKGK